MEQILMKFTKEFLLYSLGEENIISDKIDSKSRWSIKYRRVFKHDDKFFETYYSIGATESQDQIPYDEEEDLIECREVFPEQVTVTVYR